MHFIKENMKRKPRYCPTTKKAYGVQRPGLIITIASNIIKSKFFGIQQSRNSNLLVQGNMFEGLGINGLEGGWCRSGHQKGLGGGDSLNWK